MTAWVIAAREVREKARLFALCAALAVLPFAATLLPGTRGSASLTIAVVGGFLAAIVGLGVAATLGASTIARDLSERRLSFYFTKPVSAAELWLGKAAAGLLISLGAAAIIAVPTVLASKRQWRMHWLGDVQPLVALAIGIVVTFFVAHVLSSVIRSRSPLLALDFLFLAIAAGAVYLMLRPLAVGDAVELVLRLQLALAVALLLVVAVAPVWQLANGRSDIRRSHAALMRFLWPAVAIVLLVAGGFVAWVVYVAPEDVRMMALEQSPRGTSVLATGMGRGRMDFHATFLIDGARGTYRRIGTPLWWGAQFSRDGRIAAWVELEELHTTNGPTGIPVPRSAWFLLSDDGSRGAVVRGSLLTVYEIATAKILASVHLDGLARQRLFFVTPDLVRIIEHARQSGAATPLRIYELDVRARKLRKTGERAVREDRMAVSVSRDGSRMLIHGANVIVDGRTGATIAQLDAPRAFHSEMLHDGRVVLIARENGVARLRTFERDGTPRHVIPLGGLRGLWIAGETASGELILAALEQTMLSVDVDRGAIEREMRGVRGPVPRLSVDPRLIVYEGELVGLDGGGKLVAWKSEGRAPARPLLQSR